MSVNRISGPRGAGPAGAARRSGGQGDGSFRGLVDAPQGSSAGSVASAGAAHATGAAHALSALLQVQERDGERGRNRKAQQRGADLIALLEGVQEALLSGRLGRDRLEMLRAALARDRGMASDPELAGIIADIELRAEVELAKLDAAEARRARG